MNQRDLAWVRIPFTNLGESKVRPAIIVSNDGYNEKVSDVVICALTSKLENKPYSIYVTTENLETGKLPVKSIIRADKIMEVEKALVVKSFAKPDIKTFDSLIEKIIKLVKRY